MERVICGSVDGGDWGLRDDGDGDEKCILDRHTMENPLSLWFLDPKPFSPPSNINDGDNSSISCLTGLSLAG
jgi:hypothetical protein